MSLLWRSDRSWVTHLNPHMSSGRKKLLIDDWMRFYYSAPERFMLIYIYIVIMLQHIVEWGSWTIWAHGCIGGSVTSCFSASVQQYRTVVVEQTHWNRMKSYQHFCSLTLPSSRQYSMFDIVWQRKKWVSCSLNPEVLVGLRGWISTAEVEPTRHALVAPQWEKQSLRGQWDDARAGKGTVVTI